jgi:hypothetical protein
MSYNPQNPNGQTTSANSSPVVLAGDQSTLTTDHAKIAGSTTSVNSGATDTGTQRVTISNDSTGQIIARGNVASGSTDSGNPVKVGGVYNSAAPSFTTGQRGDLQLDVSGNLKVATTPGGTQTVSGTITANAGTGTFAVNNSQVGGAAISAGNGISGTGVQRVTLASDSTGQVALATGTNSVGTVGLNTGANTIGAVGINAGTNAIGSVNLAPTATGGWSVSSQTSLSTTATVSGAAGKFGGYMFFNPNNTVAYIQVFDMTGAVTLGTTSPTFVIPLPAGGAANVEFTIGIGLTNGIKIAATTTATGATTVATALTGFVLYK